MNKILGWLKTVFIGKSRELSDQKLFHKISLIALFAWVGLGADGLSSSCYGPEEAFKALGAFPHLSLFVALAAVVTIVAICASYSQIIELFPTGGGGYLVASKLLSPAAGVVSGCALLIDYVLTVTISVASSGDALFSILPPAPQAWKLPFVIAGVAFLTLLNLRGVKESVLLWVPVFFVFIATHAFVFLYVLVTHFTGVVGAASSTVSEVHAATSQFGWLGMLALLLKAYSMGAGTYTGIEAVSNGLPILREPRVETGRRTMRYMGASLAITVAGLLLCYLLMGVEPQKDKTLNAVLFEQLTQGWPGATGFGFVLVTLASEAALLFIAAQAGFLDGPRVLANMALDRWFPTRFANLSDRFVTQNGVLLIGAAALVMMVLTRGSVALLIVLYSINVFITFSLSQLGMVRHWWKERRVEVAWKKKMAINGIGVLLTGSILISLTVVKFHQGGWITLLATGLLVAAAFAIKRHYAGVLAQLRRLDAILPEAEELSAKKATNPKHTCDPKAKTAVLFVNGFNGLGLHTVLNAVRLFGGAFKNFVFVQVGVVDAGNFKGAADIDRLKTHIRTECDRYANYVGAKGHDAMAFTAVGPDVVEEIAKLASTIIAQFPNAVFFGGQLLFERETLSSRWLHNHTIFALQRRLFLLGLPFVILPIRV
ncbi:MAG: APC family permease [Verrucomicrobia bacterium]|nr:APC family permease [Verrucomicrobiota bacterium]